MLLPNQIFIGGINLATVWLFFVVGIVYGVFLFWYEGRKDGFADDRLFDLMFSIIATGGLVFHFLQRFLLRKSILHPDSIFLTYDALFLNILLPLLAMLVPLKFFTIRWKWSAYRILDILTIAFTYLIIILSLGQVLIYGDFEFVWLLIGFLVLHVTMFRYRGYKFLSGFVFISFLLFLMLSTLLFFRLDGYLLFCFVLFTIGFVTFYFRVKKAMKVNRQLPAQLMSSLRNKLMKKEKQLDKEQKMLIEEDAFLQEGRDTSNSEIMDEAILEDSQKEITDLKLSSIKLVQMQVKKALARIKLGSYGICEVCGDPIDNARLKAYPEATKCLECSEDEE
jgi:DnaK suppressor protein